MEMMSPKSREKSVNLGIPETVTSEFCQRIRNLPRSVKTDWLHSCFLSKFVSQDTDPPELRRSRAIEKWLAVELTNEATTTRLQTTHPEYQILPGVEFSAFVEWTTTFIDTVVESVPPFECLIGSFSGGASTSRSRKTSHPAGKYLGEAHATADAAALFRELELPGWTQYWDPSDNIRLVSGNVLFTVPKNAEIDRVCCKEPDINMFLQKGLGNHLRRRLRRFGINLNDQSINRNLARVGSVDGSLATLDLSSASDSVSYGLVELLMPLTWFTLLSACRSPITVVDGVEHRNEMFSAMGNGFTFELESLLFFALSKATAYFTGTRGRISVYGDDIICPQPMSLDLIWVLKYFGFSVNTAKSFYEGSFRESCGGHYDCGRDVTPFYLRAPMQCLTDVILMANSLRKWSGGGPINDPDTWETWCWLRDMVPTEFWGGRDYSDKYRLVTPCNPNRRMVPVRDKSGTGLGGYIHWLNSTDNRDLPSNRGYMLNPSNWEPHDPVETSTRSFERQVCRSKPVVEVYTRLQDCFYEEIVPKPS